MCHALTNLVEKNNELLQRKLDEAQLIREFRLTTGELQQNINILAAVSTNFLSILFNVFSQTIPSHRSPISDCIKAFLSISTPEVQFCCFAAYHFQDLNLTFTKVVELLQMNLKNPTKPEKSELPTLAQTAIDVANIMIPFLPSDVYEALWNLFVPLLKMKDDPNMQRRAYRSLAKLAEVEHGKQFLIGRLDQVCEILKYTETHSTSQKVLPPSFRL